MLKVRGRYTNVTEAAGVGVVNVKLDVPNAVGFQPTGIMFSASTNIGEASNIRADGMLLGLNVNAVSGMLKASACIAGSMRAAKASATDENTNVMLSVRAN